MPVLVFLLSVLLRLIALLPLRAAQALGAALGLLTWCCNRRTVHRVEVNIRQARAHLTQAQRRTLVREALCESGRSAMDIAHVWGTGARRALTHVREVYGLEHFERALAADSGLIIAAPHLGCWELLNHWLSSRTRLAILYRPPRIAALESLLRRVRGDLAPEQVRADGAGVRALYRRLAAGGTVGILPDQKPRGGEGQFAPFFGRDALTMVLLPRLAARTGATVLFAFAERLPHGRGFRIHIRPASKDIAATDLATACTALNRDVAECVNMAFTQYQWQYKRYSPPAPGQDNPYDG